MSFDILICVRHRVTRAELDAALDALGAPIAAPGEPDEFEGFVTVEFDVPGMEFIDAGGFDGSCLLTEDDELDPKKNSRGFAPACSYSLSPDDEDDRVVWIVALALARAGSGVIIDPQYGQTYGAKDEKKIETSARKWRTAVERRYEKLPAAEKEFRKQRSGETHEVFRRRLWLARTPQEEVASYLKTELGAALLKGNAEDIARIGALFPSGDSSFLESILDPCARANRSDVAKQLTAKMPIDKLREHFIKSAGWVGFAAAPYTRFFVDSGVVRLDKQTLNKARAIATDPETKTWLDSQEQSVSKRDADIAIQYRWAFPRDVAKDVDAVIRHCGLADCMPAVGTLDPVTIDGETLVIPYRIYANEPDSRAMAALGSRARVVLACLMTRHHDGYVRERYVRQLLPSTEAWVPPFIFQLLGEYVVEIQAFIASRFSDLGIESFRRFAVQHPAFIHRIGRRIVSYWQCYGHWTHPRLSEYPGFVAMNALGLWERNNGRRLLKNVKIVDAPSLEPDSVLNSNAHSMVAEKIVERPFFVGQRKMAIYTLDELLEEARNAPFFSRLGEKHRRDGDVVRITCVEDWPGPEDDDCAALIDILDSFLAVCFEANSSLKNNPLSAAISARFPVNPKQDPWHPEFSSRTELVAITNMLAHWANECAAPPAAVLELWRWYCDGHWPWGIRDESYGEPDEPLTLCVL